MDHPGSVPRPYVWRTTAMVAAAVAAFELVLLVLIGVAFLGTSFLAGGGAEVEQKVRAEAAAPKSAASGSASPETTAAVSEASPKLARGETSVMVLNGNGIQGAAAQATEEIRRFAYIITGTGNAPRTDFARSLVMYRPGFRGEALRLARDLGVGRVAPLDGMRAADLQGAQVALIVGAS
ncbi:MAG: LytR C-terminal domain-containing protein [Actinobacteria bacterium]|nr:LytR C-terminal domain-containing protein [Actinomycetota bacterium]